MTEPERYLDAPGSELGARLLRSAHDDGPNERAWQRAFTAVGAASAVTAATGSGAASLASGTFSIWIKWLGIGVVAGVFTAISADRLLPKEPAPRTVLPAETPIQPNTEPEPPRPVAPEPVPLPAAAPVRSLVSPLSSVPKPAGDSLARELAMVDAARTRLRAGDASGTLVALDAYQKEFPRGRFGEEAGLMRAEAALLRGDCTTVRALRQAFDGDSGKSVLGRRWKALADRCQS